jgi:mRNA interferase RelE/StbE
MYSVVISNKAEKALLKFLDFIYSKITLALRNLSRNPRPAGCRKLKGQNAWSIRVGDYRVIYEIEDKISMS